jgi:putative oxidoreductase
VTSDSRGARLHRHVVTFPDGRVGAGLLVLRCAVAAAAIAMLLDAQADTFAVDPVARDIAVGLASAAILAGGLVGPASALLVALALAAIAAAPSEVGVRALVVTSAVALLLTGPGAYSIDARRHGRREIVVPPRGRGHDG